MSAFYSWQHRHTWLSRLVIRTLEKKKKKENNDLFHWIASNTDTVSCWGWSPNSRYNAKLLEDQKHHILSEKSYSSAQWYGSNNPSPSSHFCPQWILCSVNYNSCRVKLSNRKLWLTIKSKLLSLVEDKHLLTGITWSLSSPWKPHTVSVSPLCTAGKPQYRLVGYSHRWPLLTLIFSPIWVIWFLSLKARELEVASSKIIWSFNLASVQLNNNYIPDTHFLLQLHQAGIVKSSDKECVLIKQHLVKYWLFESYMLFMTEIIEVSVDLKYHNVVSVNRFLCCSTVRHPSVNIRFIYRGHCSYCIMFHCHIFH